MRIFLPLIIDFVYYIFKYFKNYLIQKIYTLHFLYNIILYEYIESMNKNKVLSGSQKRKLKEEKNKIIS
jgi:hypothetical protein